jgi:hypothetical protein
MRYVRLINMHITRLHTATINNSLGYIPQLTRQHTVNTSKTYTGYRELTSLKQV